MKTKKCRWVLCSTEIEYPDEQEYPDYVYCSMKCAILDGAIQTSKEPGSTVILP
jgi:hypothetical protein